MKTIIYASDIGWNGKMEMTAKEQKEICRSYVKEQIDLKLGRIITESGTEDMPEKELYQVLELLQNRKAECLVVESIQIFFHDKSDAAFYVRKVMIPAGIRLICISEEIDTFAKDGSKRFEEVLRKARGKNGKSQ